MFCHLLLAGFLFFCSPVRNVCPQVRCPGIEPPECGIPNYFVYEGQRCRGCDINICLGNNRKY
ncbi:hypothetical protein ACJMK2_043225 [Sinanodonta woodiana]|uniref:Uncharacterized protein n=1 Tax=Sinanodonta woodiana TaxID=1069815 RepID=A0ABD3VWR9_SINWO